MLRILLLIYPFQFRRKELMRRPSIVIGEDCKQRPGVMVDKAIQMKVFGIWINIKRYYFDEYVD